MTPTLLYRGFLECSFSFQLPISPKRLSLQAEVPFPGSCVPRERMRPETSAGLCQRGADRVADSLLGNHQGPYHTVLEHTRDYV